jgi:branched-chain amino acid transport system permease protein
MSDLRDLVQFTSSGLTSGAIYALIAVGFGVVHKTMGIVNFTQVDLVTLGGMLLYSGAHSAGFSVPAALILAVAGSAIGGGVIELVGLRPSRSRNHMILIFLTVGLSVVIRGVIKLVWGKNRMAVPPLSGEDPVSFLGATILPQALWIMAITAAAIVLLLLFFRMTPLGLAMRAVAANPTAAVVVGIPVGRVRVTSFALAGALGGLAGALVTPITTLSYDVGVLLGLKGFAAAILGGFGSFPGAIFGGVSLGLLESFGAGYLSSAYKDVIAFVVLLAVLFIRPTGLLGEDS